MRESDLVRGPFLVFGKIFDKIRDRFVIRRFGQLAVFPDERGRDPSGVLNSRAHSTPNAESALADRMVLKREDAMDFISSHP